MNDVVHIQYYTNINNLLKSIYKVFPGMFDIKYFYETLIIWTILQEVSHVEN